jgi:hypothetical protein
MEETVRTMLQYKARSEQLKEEKTCLTVAYEVSQHCSHFHCHLKESSPRHVVSMTTLNFAFWTMNLRTLGVTIRRLRQN